MKMSLFIFICLFSLNLLACSGEAQIVAKVDTIKMNRNSCNVKIKDISFFSMNQVCPLYLVEIQSAGINFDEFQCKNLVENESVAGVVIVAENGDLKLEKI